MRNLLKFFKGYGLKAILSPVLVSLEVLMEVIIPVLMGSIVNNGIQMAGTSSSLDFIRSRSILLVACALLSLCFGVSSGFCAAGAATGFSKNLRIAIYEKIQKFSFHNIDHFSQGGIVTRLTSDVFYVQLACQMIIRIAIRLPIMLIFALVMSLKISAELTRIYAFVLPSLAIILSFLSYLVLPVYSKAFDNIDSLNNSTQENLHAIRVVKSFSREEYEKKRFDNVNNSLYKMLIEAERIVALNNPFMRLVIYICIMAIAWLGSHYIVSGNMQVGDLMALFIYNFQIFFSMMMFVMVISIIMMSRSSYKRIIEILNEKIDIANPENPKTKLRNGRIEFSDVSFSYYNDPNKLTLKDINILINSGESVGIVGPTGSGKSTFIRLIARLYDVTSGSVRVASEDVRSYDLKVLRDGVSVVLQKNNLFSGTIRSTLRWGNEKASDEEIWKALELSQIADFVRTLPGGLDFRVEQQGANFSGGQRQRLCIARALLKNPKIIILDDSFSALDTATDAKLRQALKNVKPDLTKIMIAHKVLSVMDCDKIIVMDGGKISAVGNHESLLNTNKYYRDMYNSQSRSSEVNI